MAVLRRRCLEGWIHMWTHEDGIETLTLPYCAPSHMAGKKTPLSSSVQTPQVPVAAPGNGWIR